MQTSPPIPFRIEWADSQGNVTASWLAAHFKFNFNYQLSGRLRRRFGRTNLNEQRACACFAFGISIGSDGSG
jgi:hypothetical protein